MKLKISKLMDEYTDTEFFPTGGSTANPEIIKSMVLSNAKTPAKKKLMPTRKKIFLAAALAAAMVILVGAGFPEKIYQLASGTVGFREDADSRGISIRHDASLMELEDGRLFFVLDGQRTDVTDQINEDTPYIYENINLDQDMTCHSIILGGTPEHYGWFEWITVPDPFTPDERFSSLADENGIVPYYTFTFITMKNGEPYQVGGSGTSYPDWRIFSDFNPDAGLDVSDFQWLRVAADKLEIPFTDTTGKIVTTIHSS